MKAIAAADRNWGIGYRGRLLASIPEDLKFFRKMTQGKTVILGRKTLETFPLGKPLPKRRNIILSRDPDFKADGAVAVHSVDEAMAEVLDTSPDDVIIIGGESIYRAFLPYCDTAYITRIDYAYEADAYFPDLDKDPEWELSEEGEERTCFDLIYSFNTYRRKMPEASL